MNKELVFIWALFTFLNFRCIRFILIGYIQYQRLSCEVYFRVYFLDFLELSDLKYGVIFEDFFYKFFCGSKLFGLLNCVFRDFVDNDIKLRCIFFVKFLVVLLKKEKLFYCCILYFYFWFVIFLVFREVNKRL